MAATFVNKASASNVASGATIAVTYSPTNGNTLHVLVTSVDGSTTCTVKDNNLVAYTAIDQVDDAGNGVIMYTFRSPTGGVAGSPTSFTATFGSAQTFRGIAVEEWSGIDVSASPLDGHNMATKATSTTPTSNSITTTANGDAIVAGIVADSASATITAGAGYLLENLETAVNLADEKQVQGSAGAITASFNFNPTQTSIISITAFKAAASGAAPFRQRDWPLPGQPSQIEQTFAWGQNRKLLIGQDKLPSRQRDWPLPGNPEPSPYRSFEWDNRKILIGQDALPFRQRDWPLPIPADNPDARRSWTWSYNPNLIGKDQLPFRQRDWQLPTAPEPDWRRSWTIDLLQTTLAPILVMPFRQTDWPLPIGPESDSRRSWTLGLLQTTLAPGAIPFRQTDWPNPIAAEPDTRRSWATSFNPNLIGQDQLPFRQKDWPLPTPVEADARRGWASSYNLNLIGQDQLPFRQTDWQLPLPASMWQAAPLIPNLVINQPAPPPGGQSFQYITSLGGVFNPGSQSIG